MNLIHSFKSRLPAWSDWISLVLMSLASPWLAAYIHSVFVFNRGFRFYNAEVGGAYFHTSGPMPAPDVWSMVSWIGACGVPAIPTFLALLAARKRLLYRWIAWLASIALWTYICFKMEIAYH